MPRVHYETPETDDGVDQYEPDDVHTDADPLLTLLWGGDDGQPVDRKVQIPLGRVIRVED